MISKTTFALTALTVAVAVGPASAAATDCLPMDDAKATALFDRWADALPSKNPDLLLAFYAPDASFRPHDADAPLTGATSIRDYWSGVIKDRPTVALDNKSINIGCNTIAKSGTKTLSIDGEDIRTEFSMAMELIDGTWRITDHAMTPVAN